MRPIDEVRETLASLAGICISKSLLDMSYDAWRRPMSINLEGVFSAPWRSFP